MIIEESQADRVLRRLDRALDLFEAIWRQLAITARAEGSHEPISTVGVIWVVASRLRVSPHDVVASREKRAKEARAVAMYVARQQTRESYPEIARVFRCHHTAVISAVQRVSEALKRDAAMRSTVNSIETAIAAS